jgi:tripartite-type tricarboxylate transporter receptor subunit TctC
VGKIAHACARARQHGGRFCPPYTRLKGCNREELAPKGTPKEIIAKVNADVERVLALPDVREKAVTLGYRYVGGPPDKLAAFLAHEIAKWAEVAKSASLK